MRGAFVLGALLAAILFLAVAISLRIYTQLDNAARVQRALVSAQQQLDGVVRVQLEQEAALRGYLVSGQRLFLEPNARASMQFATALAAFAATTNELGIAEMGSSIANMKRLHASWKRDVAQPLLARPHARDRLSRETLTFGKVLDDRLRGETSRIHALLERRLAIAQRDLKGRINEALFGGLASIVIFGSVSITFVLSRVQMLATLDRGRSIVETLQGAFRSDLDQLPGARIGTAYLSADSDAAVGGDLYDVRRLDNTRGLVIVADVSGKGIAAAVNTAFVKYSMRTLALSLEEPSAILTHFNRVFLDTVTDPNLFVAAFVGILDVSRERFTYASAGHAGAYVRRGRSVRRLEVTGPVVGLEYASSYASRELALARGDIVLLATDGLTEARDGTGALLEDAGAMALLRGASLDPQICADELVEAVRKRNGGAVRDDLAMLVIAIDALEKT